jgi:hypothetical protein
MKILHLQKESKEDKAGNHLQKLLLVQVKYFKEVLQDKDPLLIKMDIKINLDQLEILVLAIQEFKIKMMNF